MKHYKYMKLFWVLKWCLQTDEETGSEPNSETLPKNNEKAPRKHREYRYAIEFVSWIFNLQKCYKN